VELILVRHGEARSGAEDAEKSLTDRGAQFVRRVAARVAAAGVPVAQIRHSGKRRAEQTAEIMAESVKPAGGVVAVPGLNPNDDVSEVAADLAFEEDNVMLVGHLPFMGRLAGFLVTGMSGVNVVDFHPSSAVCLTRREDGWVVRWLISPDTA